MDHSPLRKLPPEIRNSIYGMVLWAGDEGIQLEPTSSSVRITSDLRHPLALTEVCRAIKGETSLMFFNINSFTIQSDSTPAACKALQPVTTTIGAPNSHAMRTVKLEALSTGSDCIFRYLHNEEDGCGCDETITALHELHTWATSRRDLEIDVTEIHDWGSNFAGLAHLRIVPLHVEHLASFKGSDPGYYLHRYLQAFGFGLTRGAWRPFEHLTGLQISLVSR